MIVESKEVYNNATDEEKRKWMRDRESLIIYDVKPKARIEKSTKQETQ